MATGEFAMNQQLPPFSWLQAFEATARNSSFTRAALELGITQAAISHRIRNLEELVGTKLFVRDGNSVSLTAAAHEFLSFDSGGYRRGALGDGSGQPP